MLLYVPFCSSTARIGRLCVQEGPPANCCKEPITSAAAVRLAPCGMQRQCCVTPCESPRKLLYLFRFSGVVSKRLQDMSHSLQGAHFTCHDGKMLPTSFVDDGVCDCCDGGDERQPTPRCRNRCAAYVDEELAYI